MENFQMYFLFKIMLKTKTMKSKHKKTKNIDFKIKTVIIVSFPRNYQV